MRAGFLGFSLLDSTYDISELRWVYRSAFSDDTLTSATEEGLEAAGAGSNWLFFSISTFSVSLSCNS